MNRKDRSISEKMLSAAAWLDTILYSTAGIYFIVTFNVLESLMLLAIAKTVSITTNIVWAVLELIIDNFSASSIERKRLIKYGMDKEMITEDHITAAVYSTAIDAMAKNPNYANTDFDFVRKMSRVAAGLDTQESLVVEQPAIKKETPKAINKPVVVETVEVKTTTATKKDKEQYTIEFVDNGVVLKTSDNQIAQTISYEDINQTTQEDIESGIVPDPTCYGYAILEDSKVFIFMDMMKALKIYA